MLAGPVAPYCLQVIPLLKDFFFLSEQHLERCSSCGAAAPAERRRIQSARRSEPDCKLSAKLTIEAETHPPPAFSLDPPPEQQNKEGKHKQISLKSCFHFPQHCSVGMKLSYFPWGLAQPKNRHIIFYHNWMCLQSPTAWQRPQHMKSGGFSKARGLSLVRDGPKFAFEQCA